MLIKALLHSKVAPYHTSYCVRCDIIFAHLCKIQNTVYAEGALTTAPSSTVLHFVLFSAHYFECDKLYSFSTNA